MVNNYRVEIRQFSDSDSATTAAQFSQPQEYRLSECEPSHEAKQHNKTIHDRWHGAKLLQCNTDLSNVHNMKTN